MTPTETVSPFSIRSYQRVSFAKMQNWTFGRVLFTRTPSSSRNCRPPGETSVLLEIISARCRAHPANKNSRRRREEGRMLNRIRGLRIDHMGKAEANHLIGKSSEGDCKLLPARSPQGVSRVGWCP